MSAVTGETDATTGLVDNDAGMRPFLDILKEGSSSSMNLSTVRSLALKTFAHPQIFSGFDEFKNHCSPLIIPQTQNDPLSGADGPHTSLFNTLDLFSFGTLKDYNARQHTESEYYLPLNEQALAKLGQLTVLSSIQEACINGNTSISYDSISQALGLTGNDRAVEDVLIRCLYANVLKGRLCQKTRSFGWQGESLPVVSSRDVPPAQISNLLSALRGLEKRLEESRIGLASAQEEVTQGLEGTVQYWKSIHNEKSAHLKETLFKDGSSKGAMGGEGPGSRRMDIRRQGTAGVVFPGGAVGSDAAQNNSLRRSSKRSRGGMATKLVTDAAGYRT